MPERWRITIQGACQGVGFRPFVYRLARRLRLTGWVSNTNAGVIIEVQGRVDDLEDCVVLLQREKPDIAIIHFLDFEKRPLITEETFSIVASECTNTPTAIVLPDLATCADCLREIKTKGNRRYQYPFTNCTNCGPRFSIIEKLPYDRHHTTMKHFAMCDACRNEYDDPDDRRFHAQPNACPACGPQLALWAPGGETIAVRQEAMEEACRLIQQGAILAVKGIGGFQLIVDASNEESIFRLRNRKQRKDKPFALMYPNLELIGNHCHLSKKEEELLQSYQAPIVLLRSKCSPFPMVAPGNPYLGIMLPYSPLHHLLLERLQVPVIATSGNRADEPICIDDLEALSDLDGIADYFLVHDRPIARHVDDSIVKVAAGKEVVFRRARGYSSIPLKLKTALPPSLAVGGHLKNSVAIANGSQIHISQHIGDLDNLKAFNSFTNEIRALLTFYGVKPEVVVADSHPDYQSTIYASTLNQKIHSCQHHAAHLFSCMAEHQLEPPLVGFSWDGTGYGLDDTVWGGECLRINADYSFERLWHLRPFSLPCGERAMKEPRLSALGLLYEIYGEELFENQTLHPVGTLKPLDAVNLKKVFSASHRKVRCSSMGRLFDGIASLIGVMQETTFEGQAAMRLEFISRECSVTEAYPFILDSEMGIIDWEPMVREIMGDLHQGVRQGEIAAKFHQTLIEIICAIAHSMQVNRILLSGGVFQNTLLLEHAEGKLRNMGIEPFWNQRIPPNDGGISVGQLYSLNGVKSCV